MDKRPPSDQNFAGMYGSQGFSVANGNDLFALFARHDMEELGLNSLAELSPRFCGVVTVPLGERRKTAQGDHPYVMIFSRLWPSKPVLPQGEHEQDWLPVDELHKLPVISFCREYVEVAINVVLGGRMPYYVEIPQ